MLLCRYGAFMNAARPWKVATSPIPGKVVRVHELSAAWHVEQVRLGIYTHDEMDALELPMTHPDRECSWVAPPELMYGPMTLTARSKGGEVVAGVELWQQQRDRYWFLEMLIRDQDPTYAGVGKEVTNTAIEWLSGYLKEMRSPFGVKVHAMAQERRAVKFWTRLMERGPDFDDAYQRAREFFFPAVGWVIVATPPGQAKPAQNGDA